MGQLIAHLADLMFSIFFIIITGISVFCQDSKKCD